MRGGSVRRLVGKILSRPEGEIPRDRFFSDLGMDQARRDLLLAALVEQWGPLPPDLLADDTSLNKLDFSLPRAIDDGAYRLREGRQPGLWIMPAVAGEISWAGKLLDGLVPEYELYTVQARSAPRLEQLASLYVAPMLELGRPPYRLLGHWLGCKLTYEVARQLHAKGAHVDFVGLLAGFPDLAIDVGLGDLLKMSLRFPIWARGRSRLDYKLEVQWLDRWIRYRLTGNAPPWLSRGYGFARDEQVFIDYRAPASPLQITVFRTRDRLFWPSHCAGAGWHGIALGGVRVVDLPGSHKHIIWFDAQVARAVEEVNRAWPGASPEGSGPDAT